MFKRLQLLLLSGIFTILLGQSLVMGQPSQKSRKALFTATMKQRADSIGKKYGFREFRFSYGSYNTKEALTGMIKDLLAIGDLTPDEILSEYDLVKRTAKANGRFGDRSFGFKAIEGTELVDQSSFTIPLLLIVEYLRPGYGFAFSNYTGEDTYCMIFVKYADLFKAIHRSAAELYDRTFRCPYSGYVLALAYTLVKDVKGKPVPSKNSQKIKNISASEFCNKIEIAIGQRKKNTYIN